MINNLKNIFFIIILAAFISTSCTKTEEDYNPPEMVTEITPSGSDQDYSDDVYSNNTFSRDSEKPLININSNELLISVMNLNLDLDTQEEQILVLKKRNDTEGKILIVTADFDNVQNSYKRVWEAETHAENTNSFVVYLEDLIGDHNNEIICSGRDSDGQTTLDIFWNDPLDNNKLGFIPVFNVAERGTIDINQQERSRGYHQGLKNGLSYTITVTNESYADEAPQALIKSIFYWDFPLKKYVRMSQEIIENTVVAENQLSEILEGTEDSFYRFISGPWYNGDNIIYFDPSNKSSTFFTDDIQETFSWVNSYKVLSNLLYIRCRNEIITYIENEVYVRIIGLDEVMITVRDIDTQTGTKGANEIWSNQYTRMNSDMKNATVKDIFSVIDESNLPELSGQYISDSGDIVEFYGSDFYMKTPFEEINGGFAVYSSDVDILSLKIIDDKGIVTEERTFAINYSEEYKENFIERTLVLTPGTLSIYGFHAYDTEFFRYSQIETLELSD